jgi:hypothetical protein
VAITLKNGIYHFVGKMDEYFDFDELLKASEPLKVNLGKVESINSMGVRKFLAFSLAWSPRRFEFHECPPEFIANVNVIPQMLGSSCDETQIVSLYVPYSCEQCQQIQKVLFTRADITLDPSGKVILPPRQCKRCRGPLDLDVELSEYFTFMTV